MEKGYKKQHYLSCSYLSKFAIQNDENLGIENIRKRRVFAFLKSNKQFSVNIESQGQERFHFSKTSRKAKEEQIAISEVGFNNVVEKIISNLGDISVLKDEEKMTLMLFAIQIHFGNPIFTIPKHKERFSIWNVITMDFLAKEVFNFVLPKKLSKDQYFKLFITRCLDIFHISIVKRCDGADEFCTSDNPSVIFSVPPNNGRLSFGILPLSFDYLLVYYRKKTIAMLTDCASNFEVGVLNGLQVEVANNNIYSSSEFASDDIIAIKKIREKKPLDLGGKQSHDSYETRFVNPDFRGISFLKPITVTILINGHSCSGKSTLRESLKKFIPKELNFYEFDYDKNWKIGADNSKGSENEKIKLGKKMVLNTIFEQSQKLNLISDVLLPNNELYTLKKKINNRSGNVITIRLFCSEDIIKKREKVRRAKNPNAVVGYSSMNPEHNIALYDLNLNTSKVSPVKLTSIVVKYMKERNLI